MKPQLEHAYATREVFVQRLSEDLLGGPSDARISEPPLSRFVVGILYPVDDRVGAAGAGPEAERETDLSDETATDAPGTLADPGVSMARVRYPSSIGMTFAVGNDAGATLDIKVTADQYTADDKEWVRGSVELRHEAVVEPGYRRVDIHDGLQLVVHVRPGTGDALAVTLALVNTQSAKAGEKDARCWFAPVLGVTPVGTVLRERPVPVIPGTEEDEVAGQRLLFRDVRTFAVGHGCGVEWEDPQPASIRTTFLPRHELLLSEPAGGVDLDLSMDTLAADESFRVLDELVSGYRRWIADTGAQVHGLGEDDRETLGRHMRDAAEAADRMEAGIRLLRSDSTVRQAFRMTNLAMAEQRSRQEFHRQGSIGNPPSTAGATWRPFQLAFILTNLEGVADATSPDRLIADVLWFPTGGGKTEAYLGLIGISIMLRRIRDPRSAGVSVLMRYTLRLLTLQQYERATGLVCALERLRALEMPDAAEVSIGLWVGAASTPNDVNTAVTALKKAREGKQPDDDGADPVQLRSCPWCGTPLDHENYVIVGKVQMIVRCGTDVCAFRNGLPVHIIDSDVYTHRPSLILGTVDKFAMMPWKQEVGKLLGASAERRGDNRVDLPPDLIIQDELHLISGPLGTMVGLYETALDAIVGREVRPKIVASTATIRRAREQVSAVFAREAKQFPPPGLTYRDSFFAVEAPRGEKADREYVGVMAPGSSHATLMIRVYASLLQSAASIAPDDPDADLYWTLLGYFNSLRVLGGAFMQVIDDVPDQMGVIARRRGEDVRPLAQPREMTSRKRSGEIPRELEILGTKRGTPDAADVVLATNMISVGVDVDRLGLMAVMGQPQTTSEYIQATSRVGRREPGLVVTIYNASRSRDLSHYENFAGYHRALYRYVEATSATPFAPRAQDRALHAVLVSLARHMIKDAGPNKSAGTVADWRERLTPLIDTVVARAEQVGSGRDLPASESAATVREALNELVAQWLESRVDHYEGWFDKARGALLVEAGARASKGTVEFPPDSAPWATLTSMRDVDAESSIVLKRRRRRNRA